MEYFLGSLVAHDVRCERVSWAARRGGNIERASANGKLLYRKPHVGLTYSNTQATARCPFSEESFPSDAATGRPHPPARANGPSPALFLGISPSSLSKTGVYLPAAALDVLRDLPAVPRKGSKGGGASDASRSCRPGAGDSRLAGSGENLRRRRCSSLVFSSASEWQSAHYWCCAMVVPRTSFVLRASYLVLFFA